MAWSKGVKWDEVSLELPTPEKFTRSQWQKQDSVPTWWIGYKVLFCSYVIVTWLLSVNTLGRDDSHGDKFFIYLTSWAYTTLVVKSILGVYIVVEKKFMKKSKTYYLKLPWHYKLYWVLFTISLSVAGGITGSFWATVYDSDKHPLDFINLTSHLFNTIIMTIDFILVAHPFRLLHIHWPLGYTFIYFLFSYIYYLCGGTDRTGNHAIYPTLDWSKPLVTFIICFLGLSFLILVHIMYWILQLLKYRVYKYFNNELTERNVNNNNSEEVEGEDCKRYQRSNLL